MISRRIGPCVAFLGFLLCGSAWAQLGAPKPTPASGEPPPAADAYGRTTPRGTVLGFLAAARKGDDETAARYLNTRLKGKDAAGLAHKLFVVMDRRLPTRLNQLSDRPEGSLSFPAEPNRDLVGPINSASGEVEAEIIVERLDRGKAGFIWLFSRETLEAIPELYRAISTVPVEDFLPGFLVRTRIAQVALYAWLALLLGLPLLFYLMGPLNRVISPLAGRLRRRLRNNPNLRDPEILPRPLRVLALAGIIRWALSEFSFPLLARLVWSGLATFLTIAGCVWLTIRVNAWVEEHLRRQLGRRNLTGAVSFLRFARGTADVLAVFVGVLVALHYWGVGITAALTGLGVGGIAVALAAQKTLENVIGGVSLIFDRAVRVGDFLKVGDTMGTVKDVGLRSIQIRTLERTVVTVPNGQIASMSLENMSLRDKFWFYHIVGLAYETTASQIRSILNGLSSALPQHPSVETDSARVRFLRFGTSSLDLEVFAYCRARDWPHFLEIQGQLLLQIMDIVQAAGTRLALPSQRTYLASSPGSEPAGVQELARRSALQPD
jgi:MscS family membrane protein